MQVCNIHTPQILIGYATYVIVPCWLNVNTSHSTAFQPAHMSPTILLLMHSTVQSTAEINFLCTYIAQSGKTFWIVGGLVWLGYGTTAAYLLNVLSHFSCWVCSQYTHQQKEVCCSKTTVTHDNSWEYWYVQLPRPRTSSAKWQLYTERWRVAVKIVAIGCLIPLIK